MIVLPCTSPCFYWQDTDVQWSQDGRDVFLVAVQVVSSSTALACTVARVRIYIMRRLQTVVGYAKRIEGVSSVCSFLSTRNVSCLMHCTASAARCSAAAQ